MIYYAPLQRMKACFAFLSFLLLTISAGFSQSNECATATVLTNLSNYCSATAQYTNVGATSSGYTNAACWTGSPTEDVWFTFVAIGTDVLLSVEGTGTGGGTIVQPRLALYTGNCTTLTQLGSGCSNGSAGSGTSQIYAAGLVQGTTYFIRVSSTQASEGTFQLCINNYTPPASASADCGGAGKLCNKNPVSAGNLSGGGSNTNEVSGTCMGGFLTYETNSIWYTWTCATAGTLTFSILPANASDDIDFGLWQLNTTNPCGSKTLIRCTATSFVNPLGTGLNTTAADQNEAIGYDGSQDGFVQQVNMTAGTSYAILINNASAASGFTINWGGTGTFVGPDANITSPDLSVCVGEAVTLNGTTSTNYTGLNWNFTNGPGNPVSATGPGPHTVTYPAAGTYTAILNASGAGGCVSTEAVQVTVANPVTPTFTAVGPLCQNAVINLPATSANGISGTWSPAPSTATAGTTVYTFTPSAGQCASTTTMSVTVNAAAIPNFAALGPYCTGAAVPALGTTSPNGISGTWSPATISNTASGSYTFTPATGQCASNQVLSVTVSSSIAPNFAAVGPFCNGAAVPALATTSPSGLNGTWSPATISNTVSGSYTFTPAAGQCGTTQVLNVVINSPATPNFATVGPFCSGATVPALGGTSPNGIAGTWSPATISNTASGAYTFTPNAGQCANNQVLNVVINSQTVPNFAAVGPFCSGAAVPALATASPNGVNGTWSPAAISNTASGSYTFTPASGQCATTQVLNVVINAQTAPTFTALANVCQNAAAPVLPGSSTNSPAITGTWSPASFSTSAAGTFTSTFTPSAGQCAATATLSLTVDPIVVPAFSAIPNQCTGATPPALPASSTNGVNGTWNPSAINTSTAGSFNFTFTPSAGQCSQPVTITVTVGAQPVPAFTQIPPFCQNTTAPALPTTSNDGFTGTWSPSVVSNTASGTYTFTPGGSQCADIATMNITVNPQITPAFAALNPVCQNAAAPNLLTTSANGISGTWSPASFSTASAGTFTSTFTPNAGQCAISVNNALTVNATPVVSVNPASGTVCQGQSIPLAASGATNYTWTPSATLSDNDVANVTATPAVTTTYTVTGESNNCSANTTVVITVSPLTNTSFTTVGPFCAGTVIAPFPATSNNGVSGTWSPAVIDNTATGSYTFTPDAGQCATQFISSIVITQPVQTQFNPIAPICEGEGQSSLPVQDLNGISGTWSPSVISNQASGTYTFTPAASECALSGTVSATVYPNPVASFSMSDNELDVSLTDVKFFNNSTDADTYDWTFGDGTTSNEVNPDHTYPPQAGTYTISLVASNAQGCSDEMSLILNIKEDLFVFVPNSFTPDGDAYNNTFEVSISGDFDEYNYTMKIFDRWGETIFETHDAKIGWDGTYQGKLVQSGVYTWTIDLKLKSLDDRRTYTGSVLLLK